MAKVVTDLTPHSLEAEAALLGAVLVDGRNWAHVASLVRQEDFFRAAHQTIFGALQRLSAKAAPPDLILLVNDLRQAGQLEEVGGPAYVSGLTDGVPRGMNVEHYAAIVRNKAQLRHLLQESETLREAVYRDDHTAVSLIDDAVRRLMTVVGIERSGLVNAGDAVRSYASALQAGTAGEPVPTGYLDVDALIGGFRPSDLVIVAARPSVGKTSFALGIAESIARAEMLKTNRAVPFFSLEMKAVGLAERMLAWGSQVSMQAAIRGTATLEQYANINDAVGSYDNVPLKIQDSAATLTEIEAWCQRIRQDFGLAAVVVDYLQLMVPEGKQSSQEQEISGISRGLKRLGKLFDVPMIVLSQLSRAPEGRADKRPHLSDLRGSGALEQDADIAMLLFRPELHARTPENDGICEVIVSKHRNGPTGIVRVFFNKELAQFRNLAKSD